ncbi:hypothetical protein AMTRI_Chr13g89220 [Amborella trichopoda]
MEWAFKAFMLLCFSVEVFAAINLHELEWAVCATSVLVRLYRCSLVGVCLTSFVHITFPIYTHECVEMCLPLFTCKPMFTYMLGNTPTCVKMDNANTSPCVRLLCPQSPA